MSHNAQVLVHYVGLLDDGQVFDSSEGKPPFQFELGQQQVVQGMIKPNTIFNVR